MIGKAKTKTSRPESFLLPTTCHNKSAQQTYASARITSSHTSNQQTTLPRYRLRFRVPIRYV